jgi:hypothetical protein
MMNGGVIGPWNDMSPWHGVPGVPRELAIATSTVSPGQETPDTTSTPSPSLSTLEFSFEPSPLDMTSRINIARPAGRGGYSPDPHGLSSSRPTSSGFRAANPDDPLDKVREFGKQFEDNIEIHTQPLKPHLPAIGRFLIVVTFLEDSIRILTQWGDQLWYLQK